MELIAGLEPDDIRGEDWNLNNRLDDNENDGEGSLPEDEPDDVLDGGWAAYLTASSLADGATASGLPRLYFPATTAEAQETHRARVRSGQHARAWRPDPRFHPGVTHHDSVGLFGSPSSNAGGEQEVTPWTTGN